MEAGKLPSRLATPSFVYLDPEQSGSQWFLKRWVVQKSIRILRERVAGNPSALKIPVWENGPNGR
jgi:hypothetical protein